MLYHVKITVKRLRIAHTIVDNARVVLDAAKFMDNREDANSKLPHMIGVDAPDDNKKV